MPARSFTLTRAVAYGVALALPLSCIPAAGAQERSTAQVDTSEPASQEAGSKDPIVVTGARLDGPVLFINVRRVAEKCAECVRAMAELKTIGAVTRKELRLLQGDLAFDGETLGNATQTKVASSEANSAIAEQSNWRVRERRKPTVRAMIETSGRFGGTVASYFGQIEKEVMILASAYQQVYRAPKVTIGNMDADKPKGALDITDALIATLDASSFRIDLARPDPR